MESVTIPELLYVPDIVKPLHIYPCHRGLVFKDKTCFHGFEALFLKTSFIIIHDSDLYLVRLLLTDMDEGARRQTALLRPLLHQFSHGQAPVMVQEFYHIPARKTI